MYPNKMRECAISTKKISLLQTELPGTARNRASRQSSPRAHSINMLRTTLLGFFLLLLLPLDVLGAHFHDVVKREAKDHHEWNYEDKAGPNHWPTLFKKCGGSRQSPIDIDTKEVDFNDELDEFVFDNYDDPLEDAKIVNNGHTIQINPGKDDAPRIIDEGGMDDKYKFLQLHFHWGSDDKKGSEHRIDGQTFPLEMHLVHINTNYKTKEQATQKEDGLAVLAVLFKLDDEDNSDLTPIIDKLDDVRKEGAEADMDDFSLESLLPDDKMPYYRYKGSLTTPPCNEIVTWTIFKEFVPISEKQLQMFRSVKEVDEGEPEEALVDNFRSPQELHGRVVEVSGEGNGDNSASAFGSSMLMLLSALTFFL